VSTILPDELLSQLMAVGQLDILVGLPTLNHADTVAASVRAAHVVFDGRYARERTLLLNVDGGSSDGTPEAVREASFLEGETLLASFSLRTRHRISAPYHGVPGKASGIHTIFAAADLLQARAVAVLDPEVTSVTPDSLAMLLRPVMADEMDFVSPAYARHPLDGALVTQLVRPLFRSSYGLRLREPLAGEFACSGRFAARCLEFKAWESEHLRAGIDLWLSTVAATGPYRVGEARLGPRQLAPRARPGVAALVPQVLDALFTNLRLHEAAWTARDGVASVSLYGEPVPIPPAGAADAAAGASVFREGVRALEPILAHALEPATLEAVRAAAAASAAELSDELWVRVVGEIAAAHRKASLSRDHLGQAAVPLYLGRVAAFHAAHAGDPAHVVEQALEELCLRFERSRPEFVRLWTAAAR
jgi:hypothetical protein